MLSTPHQGVLDPNLENAPRSRDEHNSSDVRFEGREKFLCQPGGTKQPAALRAVGQGYDGAPEGHVLLCADFKTQSCHQNVTHSCLILSYRRLKFSCGAWGPKSGIGSGPNLTTNTKMGHRMKIKPVLALTVAVSSIAVGEVSHAAAAAPASPQAYAAPASDATSWYNMAAAEVDTARRQTRSDVPAKNVILFVGDGMGVSTVTAARILQGQQPNLIGTGGSAVGQSGEENFLSFEKFAWLAHSKTYSVNQQTPDSAPTMTAMVSGIKTNGDELAVDQTMTHGTTQADCMRSDLAAHALKTILEYAEDNGKSTGLVSTARITHATPAANYAHTTNRDWESDSNQPAAGCAIPDIARQLVEFSHGNGIDLAFGGGRSYFLPNTTKDPEYPIKTGNRKDGRDLTQEWVKNRAGAAFIYDNTGFNAIDPGATGPVLGLFEPSHMQYEADRSPAASGEPSLAQMTDKAIRVLNQNKKGFYLHVEAGRIDHAHHSGNAYRALADTMALSDAVQQAQATLQELKLDKNTLIIVTADHSHTFTIAGYPQRGNNILGKVVSFDKTDSLALADDKNPYTTLSYANGGGFGIGVADGGPARAGRIQSLLDIDTTQKEFHQEALVPFAVGAETHAGEDVAIYATGPGSHIFHGTMDNSAIFHVMKYAYRFK